MKSEKVSVLIPAHNEEKFIYSTVSACLLIPGVAQVVVVDDASTDGTGPAAAAAGAFVIRLDSNLGKGGALNRGAWALTGDYIMLLDADLGACAREARGLLAPLEEGRADMTVAVFPPTGLKSGFGLVKGLASMGIKYFTGLKLNAPLSGQRAFKRDCFFRVLPFARGYGVEVALTIKAAKLGLKIKEVPLNLSHRVTGRSISGFWHRGRQFFHILSLLLNSGRAKV